MPKFVIATERIGLRRFAPADLDSFARLNSDPQVMEFFPKPLTRQDTSDYIQRINQKIDEQGFGFWAAEHRPSRRLMGFIGITRVSFEAPFVPAVEIGWRLAPEFWGQGLASEGARGAFKFGFETVKLDEIVAFTSLLNQRSERVMQRIGMKRSGEFDHPRIEEGHRLRRHVIYRLSHEDWLSQNQPQ